MSECVCVSFRTFICVRIFLNPLIFSKLCSIWNISQSNPKSINKWNLWKSKCVNETENRNELKSSKLIRFKLNSTKDEKLNEMKSKSKSNTKFGKTERNFDKSTNNIKHWGPFPPCRMILNWCELVDHPAAEGPVWWAKHFNIDYNSIRQSLKGFPPNRHNQLRH